MVAMPTVPSTTVAKAFRVLDLFTKHAVLTSTICMEELDIPRPTAHRLLVSLREAGVVEATGDGHYRLSLALFELGALAPERRRLDDRATAAIEALADAVGLRAHIAVRRRRHVLYLAMAQGRFSNRVRTRVGHQSPLHATSSGKILLAHAGAEDIEEIIGEGLFPHTEYTICDGDRLREHLAGVRGDGVAYSWDECIVGWSSVAAPIVGADGQVLAAVSVAASTPVIRRQATYLAAEVRRTANVISVGSAWEESMHATLAKGMRGRPPAGPPGLPGPAAPAVAIPHAVPARDAGPPGPRVGSPVP